MTSFFGNLHCWLENSKKLESCGVQDSCGAVWIPPATALMGSLKKSGPAERGALLTASSVPVLQRIWYFFSKKLLVFCVFHLKTQNHSIVKNLKFTSLCSWCLLILSEIYLEMEKRCCSWVLICYENVVKTACPKYLWHHIFSKAKPKSILNYLSMVLLLATFSSLSTFLMIPVCECAEFSKTKLLQSILSYSKPGIWLFFPMKLTHSPLPVIAKLRQSHNQKPECTGCCSHKVTSGEKHHGEFIFSFSFNVKLLGDLFHDHFNIFTCIFFLLLHQI